MPITSVDGWSTTANLNSDVNGNSIAENCSPAGINNAMREMMAQVAATPLAETAATMRTNLGLVIGTDVQAYSAAYVTLTGSQTLTNKTLTGPIFNTSPVDMQVGQLQFPATANASSNANTLDDYEEGTFTPAFSATGSTFSYLSQTGEYVKIGKLVFVYADVRLNTSGNTLAANTLTITGLPFTVGSNSYRNSSITWVATTSSFVNMSSDFVLTTTTMGVRGITAAGTANNTAQNASTALHATNGSILIVSGSYIASA